MGNCNDIYVCPDCGSENVWEPAWIDPNPNEDGKIGDRIEGLNNLCKDCGGEISDIILKEDFVGEVTG